jgi:6-phosphofructokinase 1
MWIINIYLIFRRIGRSVCMKRLAVVTSGGDAPGMNPCIRAVVRASIYNGMEIYGIERGYAGLIENRFRELEVRSVSGIIYRGGTILKTSRCEEIKTKEGLEEAARNLVENKIDGLVVIGGDGSLRGAWEIHKESGVPVVGIPATIDNDVSETDTTIGFDTAVNTAVEAIDKIRDTAMSLDRVFLVEVMGRRRGFLALEVGLASGSEFVLIPEVKYDLDAICEELRDFYRRGKTSSIVVMAEGAGDMQAIAERIAEKSGFEVRTSRLGYIQRGGTPTAISRKLASIFGFKAVERMLDGCKAEMLGIKDGKLHWCHITRGWEKCKPIDTEVYKLVSILAT